MMLQLPWPELILLIALALTLALYGLAVAGHFPPATRHAALKTPLGSAVLWGSLLIIALAVMTGLIAAARLMPWPIAVIGVGAALLTAPLLLRPMPDGFVNGRGALVIFSVLAALLAFAFARHAA